MLKNWALTFFQDLPQKKYFMTKNEKVIGVLSGEKGITKNGEKSNLYEPKIALKGNQTFFAEGCRGHLGKKINKKI